MSRTEGWIILGLILVGLIFNGFSMRLWLDNQAAIITNQSTIIETQKLSSQNQHLLIVNQKAVIENQHNVMELLKHAAIGQSP